MTLDITSFVSSLKNGGARPSLFQVTITNPGNGTADNVLPFRAKASQLPGLTLGVVPVHYKGRQTKVEGNRIYEDWTVTIIEDEDYVVRNALEEWQNKINSFEGNLRTFPGNDTSLFRSVADIRQETRDDVVARNYQLINVWPSIIAPIEMNWETEAIVEYEVTFSYDYW